MATYFTTEDMQKVSSIGGLFVGPSVLLDANDVGEGSVFSSTDAKTDVAQSWTKTQHFEQTELTDEATISWDLSSNQVTSVTLEGNRALDAPTNMSAGATYILIIKQDATGSRTLTFDSVFKFPGGTAPTLSTGASATDIITFVSDGTNMYGVTQLNFS